MSVKR